MVRSLHGPSAVFRQRGAFIFYTKREAPLIFRETLYNSYRRAGILFEAGRGISQSETTDGLAEFNAMVDEWLIQRLMLWAVSREVFDLVSGQAEYLIGDDPAADWRAPMPTELTQAGYVFTSTNPEVEEPFYILTDQEWQAVSPKDLQSTNPYNCWYQPSTKTGLVSTMGTFTAWPVPLDETIKVALYIYMQLRQVSDPTATVVFPPGYQTAVETNLAVRLAARFPKRAQLSPITERLALTSLGRLKASNSKPLLMRVDKGLMQSGSGSGTFNLLSNSYNNRL